MSSVIGDEWAPFASDGPHFTILPPSGITYSLTTDDIAGAQMQPSIRKFLHPQNGDKMFPESWLSYDSIVSIKPARNFRTSREVNPLDPHYKLPSGACLIPCGEQIFSKRVTNFMDASDIVGTKPTPLYKRSLGPSTPDFLLDHPAKKTHVFTGRQSNLMKFAETMIHWGKTGYKEFAKAVRRLEGVDYDHPKRLGEAVGALTADVNLGQGLQMLVGPPQRGKRIWGSVQHLFYNPLSGEPNKRSSSAFALREPLYFSFSEQAAALSEKQHQLNFASLMPTEAHFSKVPPILNLETLSRKKSASDLSDRFIAIPNKSSEEVPVMEKQSVSADMSKLQLPQGEIDLAGTPMKLKSLSPSRGKLPGDVRKEELQPLRSRYTHCGTIVANEPLLRQVKLRKVSPQSLKEKIKHEQHFADVQAVQILS